MANRQSSLARAAFLASSPAYGLQIYTRFMLPSLSATVRPWRRPSSTRRPGSLSCFPPRSHSRRDIIIPVFAVGDGLQVRRLYTTVIPAVVMHDVPFRNRSNPVFILSLIHISEPTRP